MYHRGISRASPWRSSSIKRCVIGELDTSQFKLSLWGGTRHPRYIYSGRVVTVQPQCNKWTTLWTERWKTWWMFSLQEVLMVQQSQLQAVLQWTLDLICLNHEWSLLLRQAPSAWLFSSTAARTVSFFEIKKHVIHSPQPKETIAPFNAPPEFECVDFNWWFYFTSWPTATSRGQSRLCDSLYTGNSWQMRGLCRLQRENVFPACT